MKQIVFNLRDFPRFLDMWIHSKLSIEQHFRDMGVPYTKGERLVFSLSEQDYLLFVLRWA